MGYFSIIVVISAICAIIFDNTCDIQNIFANTCTYSTELHAGNLDLHQFVICAIMLADHILSKIE